jgi:predicted HAD superfamily phosphohydrolase YqeG
MRTGYRYFTDIQDMPRIVSQLSVKTIIFDIEPLVAWWDSSRDALDQGIARVLSQVAAVPGLLVVCFATNSARRPSVVPDGAGIRVIYLASAGKPLHTAAYRQLPRPGVVIGDQVLTDGMLARRLGYTFLHYTPEQSASPLGPRLLSRSGDLARPLLFPHER